MIDQKDSGLIIAMIARLANEIAMIKSFNQVTLREVSKLTGSQTTELHKEVEALHAKYIFNASNVWDDFVRRAMNPKDEMTFEDLLKMIASKT